MRDRFKYTLLTHALQVKVIPACDLHIHRITYSGISSRVAAGSTGGDTSVTSYLFFTMLKNGIGA